MSQAGEPISFLKEDRFTRWIKPIQVLTFFFYSFYNVKTFMMQRIQKAFLVLKLGQKKIT